MKAKHYATALYAALRGKSKDEIAAGMTRFTAALKKRGATRLLPQILAAFPAAAHVADADWRVTVRSAQPLTEKTLKEVTAALGMDAGKTETLNVVDPELIGGLKITSPKGTMDGTVKGKLERLKDVLTRSA